MNKNEGSGTPQKARRRLQINVRIDEEEREAIRAAFYEARAKEPALTLAAWMRRKGSEREAAK